MLFTDVTFLFYFLPLALILHRISLGRHPSRQYAFSARTCLFLLTIIFYGFNQPWYLCPFFISIFFDFYWASRLSREEDPGRRKLLVVLSITQNLLLLSLFKYWPFFIGLIAKLSPEMAGHLPTLSQSGNDALVPPGISFYTFESMSFVIDVYRRKITPPRRISTFLCFIGMFPRFIAGPIVRYDQIKDQFENYRGMQWESGLTVFFFGLILKVLFADSFATFVPLAFDHQTKIGFLSAWLGLFSFSLQIYFDFSAYSIMAIGLGRCLGFEFPKNFDRPYLADGLRDFWRRWHISLSTWLRDYLYLPLGGNRSGRFKTYRNLMITMGLGGLWHGAKITFLIWGIWHGLLLCLEHAVNPLRFFPAVVRRSITFFAVMLGWVFFRASHFSEAGRVLKALFDFSGPVFNPEMIQYNRPQFYFCILGALYCFFFEKKMGALVSSPWEISSPALWSVPARVLVYFGVAFSLLMVLSSPSIPFLYFQF